MKKWFALVGVILLLIVPARAVSARGAAVVDGLTGELVFEQNAQAQLPMASTTKIMTALIAIEEGDLDRTYVVDAAYMAEGSSMYLRAGDEITLRDTLYGLMLMSGNDAAQAIAGECGGLEAFVGKMNDKAAALGLTHTHFDNPSGLDGETHYTTAQELATLAAHAMNNELFREIVSTRNYTNDGRTMVNHNKLLRLYPDAVGVKTGFTKKSGRCLVSAAERNGRRLVAVTLDAPDDWNDHISMLESGFTRYSQMTLHEAGETLYTLPVEGGTANTTGLRAANTLTLWMTQEERAKMSVELRAPRFVYAPTVAGQVVGGVVYRMGDAVLAQDALCYETSSIQLPGKQTRLEQLLEKLRSLWDR